MNANPTVGILTLGCKVNQYESEAIAEGFAADGFRVLPPTEVCDAYVVNTCTVTSESDRKVRQAVRRLQGRNPSAVLVVTGCLAQTDPDQLASIPGVDAICGNGVKLRVIPLVTELLERKKKATTPILDRPPLADCGFEAMRITHFDRTRAYIKIQDGCESRCAYCIIPQARGPIRSKPLEDVVDEVTALTENGCPEVVLTGIETASYGKDLDGCDLADLLCRIDRIPGIGRVRLGSLDPSLITPSFVSRIAGLSSLAPHFHLSMQSGSDGVLARMRRKYNTRMALRAISLLRDAIPKVQFTTDMIVGFPQETEEEFAQTLAFVEEARFLMIHVFPYSRRKGTEADRMEGQVPEAIKHRRALCLSEMQANIQASILQDMVGKTVPVLFETYENGLIHGHTPDFVEVACPSPTHRHAETLSVLLTEVKEGYCMASLQSEPFANSFGKETNGPVRSQKTP